MPSHPETQAARYVHWRSAVFSSSWLLYAGYYLCRENLRSVRTLPGAPPAQDDLTGLLFNFALAYVLGHLVSGTLSDLRSARKVALTGGLISAAATAAYAMPAQLHNQSAQPAANPMAGPKARLE